MKKIIGLLIIFAFSIALTPAIALLAPNKSGPKTSLDSALTNTGQNPDPQQEKPYEGGELIVLDEKSGQTLTISEREYLIGAVMCEMPALYEVEALKAQAVAAHTYALFVKEMRIAQPLPELKGAYFMVNTSAFSGYMTKEQAKEHFGKDFEKYYSKIEAAVNEVSSLLLKFDNKLISACYHAISPGKTENSENVFASAAPYLVSVDSEWDKNAEQYETSKSFNSTELNDILKIGKPGFSTTGEPTSWLGESKTTDAGTVSSYDICGVSFTGVELRAMFDLRSAAFSVSFDGTNFVFTVHGYGHGVGMSQFGANELAKQGKSYSEILAHYYTDTTLEKAE